MKKLITILFIVASALCWAEIETQVNPEILVDQGNFSQPTPGTSPSTQVPQNTSVARSELQRRYEEQIRRLHNLYGQCDVLRDSDLINK